MMRKLNCFILVVTLCVTSSCQPLVKLLLGIKSPKMLNDEQIIDVAKKYGINTNQLWKIDTVCFYRMIEKVKNPLLKNQLSQPLQIMSFNSTGENVVHLINCNMGLNFPKYFGIDLDLSISFL